jgi:hypothetical protein
MIRSVATWSPVMVSWRIEEYAADRNRALRAERVVLQEGPGWMLQSNDDSCNHRESFEQS